MIKKLRWRLVALMMGLLIVVMAAMIGMFIEVTYQGMKKDNLAALRQAGEKYGLHSIEADDFAEEKDSEETLDESQDKGPKREPPSRDKKKRDKPEDGDIKAEGISQGDFVRNKNDKIPQESIPCFVVGYDQSGQVYARGPKYYDLTDLVKLEQLLQQARSTGEETGILSDQNLRYLCLDGGQTYVFTDITGNIESWMRMCYWCVGIMVCAIIASFLICVLVAWRSTRPIEQVMEQQRQFVADASHELKTPLAVILTNAEMLDEDTYSKEDRERSAKSILTMSQNMRGLVDELLESARVEDGIQTDPQTELDFSRLVENQILLFEPLYFEEGRGLEGKIEENLHIRGDENRLSQVIEILLDNGCKYSDPGTVVKLTVKRQGLKRCLVRVDSRGNTLTDQECRDVFKRFYRKDPNRSMNHSYGLGLAIAQSIVQRHNGRIWAVGKNGVNSFFVQLPIQ